MTSSPEAASIVQPSCAKARSSKAVEGELENFRREVERELTGKEEEPSELIYFKIYKSQIPVIEQAMETSARMRQCIVPDATEFMSFQGVIAP